MTEKENFLRMLRGDMPEWLIFQGSGELPPEIKPATAMCRGPVFRQGGRDIFGIEYTATDSTGGMELPTPNNFILKDIHDWPDVIKLPDINDFNIEEIARKELEKIDRNEVAVSLSAPSVVQGYFQTLMAFMGFSEGLFTMACYPEEVYNLFEYLADFFDELAVRMIDAYKPDIFGIADDVSSAQNTFMSYDMWCELIKPFQVRMTNHANKLGIPISMHCCGKCEHLIDDWRSFGVIMWNPPQDMNDLDAIKKKYGRSLILNGCSSPKDPYLFSWSTEEEVRQCMRDKIDRFAPDGGYICRGFVVAAKDDPTVEQRRNWVADEYLKYGRDWYQKH